MLKMWLQSGLFMVLTLLTMGRGVASAQTGQVCPCNVNVGEAFTMAWDHDMLQSPSFRLLGGLRGQTPTPIVATPVINGNTVTFPTPAGLPTNTPAGTYDFFLEAYNTAGSARSAPITLVVGTPPLTTPTAPTNPRLFKP